METEKIEKLLKSSLKCLKQQQHKEAVKYLKELRVILGGKRDTIIQKEVDNVIELSQMISNAEGCVEPLISVLCAYSLLPEVALEMGKTDATFQLISALKKSKNESLAARSLRLLGNLAQDVSIAEKLHNEGAFLAVSPFLEPNADHSTDTLMMATRFVKYLWAVRDKREELIQTKIVEKIMTVLIKECESLSLIDFKIRSTQIEPSPPRKNSRQLIESFLKCVAYISTVSSTECANDFLGDGRGYDCIVVLAEDFESAVMKCVVSLSLIECPRVHLGNAGAIEMLVKKLKNQTNNSWNPFWVKALCLMCKESVNRVRVRHSGGLNILLDIFRDNQDSARTSAVLHAIINFIYDDRSLKVLIKGGIVDVITEQLKECVITMKCNHGSLEKMTNPCTHMIYKNVKRRKIVVENQNCESDNDDASEFSFNSSHVEYHDKDGSVCEDPTCRMPGCKWKKRLKSINITYHKVDDKIVDTRWSANPSGSDEMYPLQPQCNCTRTDHYPGNMDNQCMHLIHCLSPETTSSLSPLTTRAGSCDPPSPTMSNSSATYMSNREYDSEDSEKSTSYSPVCYNSDAGEDANSDNEPQEPVNESNELSGGDESPTTQEFKIENTKCKSRRHKSQCLLVLLSRIQHHDTWKKHYKPSEDLLDLLISYVSLSKNPVNRAARIIARFISSPTNMMSILHKPFILKLHELKDDQRHKKCDQCQKISSLCTKFLMNIRLIVESDYGMGVLNRQFLLADVRMKENLTCIIPIVVSSQRSLRRHFMINNGLMILFSILADEENNDLDNCVNALSFIAKTLHVKDPISLETRFQNHIIEQYDPKLETLAADNIVTFILEDDSKVFADRQFLCKQSDFFCAMLAGKFKESAEQCVSMKNASKDGLEYLIHLLHCGANDKDKTFKTFPITKRLQTSLDALLLADRFLLHDLKVLLISAVVQFKMNLVTADRIYIWSLKDGMGLLCVESVAYILRGKMKICDRTKLFTKIMKTDYKQQWFDDLQSMIERHFHMRG